MQQLRDWFEQRSGLPMAAKIKKILINATNSDCCTLVHLQEELDVYHAEGPLTAWTAPITADAAELVAHKKCLTAGSKTNHQGHNG